MKNKSLKCVPKHFFNAVFFLLSTRYRAKKKRKALAVKSPGDISSTFILRAYSSVGRAPVLHTGGHRFESFCAQPQDAGVVQLVRALACHARSCGFESRLPRHFNNGAPFSVHGLYSHIS